ncbi:MAG: PHP domain-containing protein [bacterium]
MTPLVHKPSDLMDLHTHTTFSDGSETPETLVDMAFEFGLTLVAITDHDSIAGLEFAEEQAAKRGIRLVRGIEFSADYDEISVHIVGLGIKKPDEFFIEMLRKIGEGRASRNPKIVQKLNELGFEITFEEVRNIAAGDIISRPHIAEALVRNGYVENTNEAFKRYLNRGRPAYQERYRPTVSEAATMIKHMGGIPILAHPGLIRFPFDTMESHISRLKSMGIEGIETHYPVHTQEMRREFSRIAQKLSLLESGGSDFHGVFKPNPIGLGTDREPITGSFLRPLLERLNIPISASMTSV